MEGAEDTGHALPPLAIHFDGSLAPDDDEVGPLHWSGFHKQLDALLQQVKDPGEVGTQAASVHCSESSEDEAAASPRAAVQLPAWLVGTDSGDAPATLVQSEQTPALNLSRSRAFTQSGLPSTGLKSYSCRRQVPEWLVSPLRGSRDKHSPFKALIEEIDAHLARDRARKASAALPSGQNACAEPLSSQAWCSDADDALAAIEAAAADGEHRRHVQGNGLLALIAKEEAAASGTLAEAADEAGLQITSAIAEPLPGSPLSSSSSRFEADTAPRQQLFRDLAGLLGDGDAGCLTLGSCAASPEQERCGSYTWPTHDAHEGATAAEAASASPRKDESPGSAPRVRILRRSVSPQQVVHAQHSVPGGLAGAMPDDGACEALAINAYSGAAAHDPDKENTPSPGAANATASSAQASAQRSVLGELHADSPLADAAEAQLRQLPDIEACLP